jgi:hypothetical protein
LKKQNFSAGFDEQVADGVKRRTGADDQSTAQFLQTSRERAQAFAKKPLPF